MTTLTITLSTILPDGQEIYQQVQLDQKDVENPIASTSANLFKAYGDLQAGFATYLAKQTTL